MQEKDKKGWFWHWGKGIYRHRKLVIIVWIVLFATMGFFAMKTPDLLKDDGFTPYGSESDRGFIALQDSLGYAPSHLIAVYTSDQHDVTTEHNTALILASLEKLAEESFVERIYPAQATRLADAPNVQPIVIELSLSTDDALQKYAEIRSMLQAPEDMALYVTGGTAVLYDMQQATKSDIVRAEMIGLPIALIVLLIIFGTILGALLPMIVGVTSVTVTLGVTYFIAQNITLSNFLPNMVTMLGLAVGIDYALFMVSRFREELQRQATVSDAVAMTAQKAGRSIFFSGIAVLIGMLGMLFIDLSVFQALCLGGVLVVTFSVIVANTLLLSLFGVIGQRINRWRVIPAFKGNSQGSSSFWGKVAYFVMRRPAILALTVCAGLIYFMLPLGDMKLGVPGAEVLPPAYESRYGSDLIDKTLDERENNPLQVFVQSEAPLTQPESLARLQHYAEQLAAIDGIQHVTSLFNMFAGVPADQLAVLLQDPDVLLQLEEAKLLKDQSLVFHAVPAQSSTDALTDQAVKDIRLLDADDMQVLVTGSAAFRVDLVDRINDKLLLVVGFVMLVTYLVLLFAFRSIIIPLKAVLMNVLSLGASLGVVVSVFQHGWFAEVLNITSTGYVTATLPVIVFCVVFGISMDYEVFLISRMMEEYEETGDNEKSTAQGLAKTGSLITSAAFILIVVVGSFIITDIEIIKALGIGLSVAVFLDATLIRIVVVPALMKMLGKMNWWAPGWIKRM